VAAHELSEPAGAASKWTARLYGAQLALERAALGAALELAAPHPDDVVLDLATGTGALLRLLAARRERPRVAVGVDASAAMLERVPQLPEDWRLINGDARRIPLPDESVDVVMCAYLMHLLDEADRRMVLCEIARVLRPRGRAVIVGLLEPRGLAGRTLLAPAQRALCRVLGPEAGWCAQDPSDELRDAGLHIRRRRISTRGYASVCLLAERN